MFMGTREERVPNSAGGVRENITDETMWAENRQKPSTFPETKSGQPVHGSVCGGVGSHHAEGTGKQYSWLLHSTCRGEGQRRWKGLEKDPARWALYVTSRC